NSEGVVFLNASKIHIIHVGHMSNKGTQALLKSDDSAIRDIVEGEVSLSVSTTDMEGVKSLNLPESTTIWPTLIDIPYIKADNLAKRLRISRRSVGYKILSLYSLFLMFAETALLILSVSLLKLRLPAVYKKNVLDRLVGSDVVVSCSDENFKETASMLPLNVYWAITWWTMLFERMMEVSVAKFFHKPLIMFPNSVGPFKTRLGLMLSKLALNNFDTLIIRDSVSFNLLKKIGIAPKMVLTSDAALLFSADSKFSTQKFISPSIGVCIGVYSQSLSKEDFKDFMVENAQALDRIVELYGHDVCFFPHYISGFEHDDLEVSKTVLSMMRHQDRARLFKIDSLEEFKLCLEQMELLISSKMHPMVLATSGYVPTVCIAYDHKQTGFLKDLGLMEYLIPLKEVDSETIVSKVGKVMKDREEIIALLNRKVPALQQGVRTAMQEALSPFLEDKICKRK
ncbi:MAG TPA: polysaccharide pyruvyl transferase family protein, partial [Candidatus Binatia bacterium]|nr:polysaccharide pyruvyl transferase family protein [Candidatus Binatia bacterium]